MADVNDARCPTCGWPLKERIEDGCVAGNCSQRLNMPTEVRNEAMRLRAEVERLTRERDEARRALDDLRSLAFMRGKSDGEVVERIKSVVESYVRADQRAESDRAALLAACEAMAAVVRFVKDAELISDDMEAQAIVALATYARARGEAARGEVKP